MDPKRYFLYSILLLSVSVLLIAAISSSKPKQRVLVFYKTAGFYHKSIPQAIRAIQELGRSNGFRVDTTNISAIFTSTGLGQYDAVVFLNTTGDVLNDAEQNGFERYIRSGKGFVGIHAATDTEYNWPWYNKLVGAYFISHPEVQEASIRVLNKNHTSTNFLPEVWQRTDEWYNFKSINNEVKVLANLDETSYKGGKNGSNHPIAWYHEFDGGRSFYTAGGHTIESYSEPLFLKHILGGIKYASGY